MSEETAGKSPRPMVIGARAVGLMVCVEPSLARQIPMSSQHLLAQN